MNVLGLITEYNPFHNGHFYHIEKSKEITGADYVIVVMSGNFVQRGTTALCDKYLRSKMALLNGADLVLELPVVYATASAEYFSMGAVSILDKLGIVNSICFGSEDGNLTSLSNVANILSEETANYQEALKEGLKDGLTFPMARSLALISENIELDSQILSSPNNILGIEYLKALKKRKSSINPYTIKRLGSDYHDKTITDLFSSATAIRTFFNENKEPFWQDLDALVPSSVLDILKEEFNLSYPILEDDISSILYYKLRSILLENKAKLTDYFDVSKDLGSRIENQLDYYTSFLEFSDLLKTRQYTLTRVRRSLLHILLDIKKEDILLFSKNDSVFYARILGFNPNSRDLLSKIKRNSTIPLLSKLADAETILDPIGKTMLEKDIFAADLFCHIQKNKFKTSIPNEFRQSIIKLP